MGWWLYQDSELNSALPIDCDQRWFRLEKRIL